MSQTEVKKSTLINHMGDHGWVWQSFMMQHYAATTSCRKWEYTYSFYYARVSCLLTTKLLSSYALMVIGEIKRCSLWDHNISILLYVLLKYLLKTSIIYWLPKEHLLLRLPVIPHFLVPVIRALGDFLASSRTPYSLLVTIFFFNSQNNRK